MKKPSDEILLQQLNRLEQWCNSYHEENPRNNGTYRGGVCRDTYKPLRDGIVFYSSGWGWRLRKNWQQAIADKRVELQEKHNRLVAWFKGESASNTGIKSDVAKAPAILDKCSYFGCEDNVCEHDINYPPPSMRFCQKHSDEVNGYIERHEIPKVLGFWIKAHGGAKRMAETF